MKVRKTVRKTVRRFWARYWSFIYLGIAIFVVGAGLLTTAQASKDEELPEVQASCASKVVYVQSIPDPSKFVKDPEQLIASKAATFSDRKQMEVPATNTGKKTWMSYKAITNKSSRQWALQKLAHTNEFGIREVNGMYIVAMGTYYSDHVGAMFNITLANGNSFPVVIGDVKDNKHTDKKNQHRNGNIVEFIVDKNAMSSQAKFSGDMSNTPGAKLNGKITGIEYIGEFTF